MEIIEFVKGEGEQRKKNGDQCDSVPTEIKLGDRTLIC